MASHQSVEASKIPQTSTVTLGSRSDATMLTGERSISVEDVPYEIIQYILIFVPDADLKNCLVVCKLWREAISDQSFWKLKCQASGFYLEKYMDPYYPSDWRMFYFQSPFNRNLIKNCSGQDSEAFVENSRNLCVGHSEVSDWNILGNGGNGWRVEMDHPGSGELPEELLKLSGGKPTSFATSYGWCEKEQVIDLLAEGFSEAMLDELRPSVYVSEWYAARHDCGNEYEFGVQLLKGQQTSGKVNDVITEFHFGPLVTPQWSNNHWKQASHTFRDYGPGLRYIRFWDKSKDTQFWAGHYGGKMAGAEVRFLIGCGEQRPL